MVSRGGDSRIIHTTGPMPDLSDFGPSKSSDVAWGLPHRFLGLTNVGLEKLNLEVLSREQSMIGGLGNSYV